MAKNALSVVSSGDPRTYGLATVKMSSNGAKVRVTFEKTGESLTFPKDALPSKPKIQPDSEDTYMVVLTPEKDAIEKIGPAEGHFQAKCVDFGRPEEGADPEPKDASYERDGKTIEYRKFTAYFEVLAGRYKGQIIPHFLRYKFTEDAAGNAGWEGRPDAPNAIHLPRLIEFCEKTGCVETAIEWPEDGNILPILLDRILKADRTVDLVVKDGFIAAILAVDYEDAEEDEEKDENAPAPKAKKSSKPAPKQDDDEDEF